MSSILNENESRNSFSLAPTGSWMNSIKSYFLCHFCLFLESIPPSPFKKYHFPDSGTRNARFASKNCPWDYSQSEKVMFNFTVMIKKLLFSSNMSFNLKFKTSPGRWAYYSISLDKLYELLVYFFCIINFEQKLIKKLVFSGPDSIFHIFSRISIFASILFIWGPHSRFISKKISFSWIRD